MENKIPKIFVNNVKKIDNNKIVFYSNRESNEEIKKTLSTIEINNKINDLFRSNDFVYKKKLHIKTKDYEEDFVIIFKSTDYLLTIDGMRIYYSDIIDIY